MLKFFLFFLFSLMFASSVEAQNANTCYYISNGNLYTNSSFTSVSLTPQSQCVNGYSGTPYFYVSDNPPINLASVICRLTGGNYYKVACPIDDYVPLLLLAAGGFGFLILSRRNNSLYKKM